jgi:hypothetical protein
LALLLRPGAAPRTNIDEAARSSAKVFERSEIPVLRCRVVPVAAVAWLSFVFARSRSVAAKPIRVSSVLRGHQGYIRFTNFTGYTVHLHDRVAPVTFPGWRDIKCLGRRLCAIRK